MIYRRGEGKDRKYQLTDSEPFFSLMKKNMWTIIWSTSEMKWSVVNETKQRGRRDVRCVGENGKRDRDERNERSERIMRTITGYTQTHNQLDGDDDGRRNRSQAFANERNSETRVRRVSVAGRESEKWEEETESNGRGRENGKEVWVDFKGVV